MLPDSRFRFPIVPSGSFFRILRMLPIAARFPVPRYLPKNPVDTWGNAMPPENGRPGAGRRFARQETDPVGVPQRTPTRRERRVSAVAPNTITAKVAAEASQQPGPRPNETMVAAATIGRHPRNSPCESDWRGEPAPMRANHALKSPRASTPSRSQTRGDSVKPVIVDPSYLGEMVPTTQRVPERSPCQTNSRFRRVSISKRN